MYFEEFVPTGGAMPHGTVPDTMREGIVRRPLHGRVYVAAIEALQDVDPRQPVFPHARDLRALQIRKADLVVTPDEGDGVHADHAGNTMVGRIVARKVTLPAREAPSGLAT
jgi:hypothetical protein